MISFDLDGVLASPPFGWNPTINRDLSLAPARAERIERQRRAQRSGGLPARAWYTFRYSGRRPRPGALDAVRAAAQQHAAHSVIVLTGRSERGRRQTQAWLDREGFAEYVDELIMNDGAQSAARHKERALSGRRVLLHADDDAATAALLARCGIPLALLDWPRNRRLSFPPGVTRYTGMEQLAAAIAALEAGA